MSHHSLFGSQPLDLWCHVTTSGALVWPDLFGTSFFFLSSLHQTSFGRLVSSFLVCIRPLLDVFFLFSSFLVCIRPLWDVFFLPFLSVSCSTAVQYDIFVSLFHLNCWSMRYEMVTVVGCCVFKYNKCLWLLAYSSLQSLPCRVATRASAP